MQYEQVRAMLLRQWTHTGGPNEAWGSEMYHDDVVLEFPQSDEWFHGKTNQQEWRERYPARLEFEPREIRGSGDLWIAEALLRYDGGDPINVVKILQFRGDKVERETLYFAEPFAAPEWRRPWAEPGPRPRRHTGLPERITGGR